MEFPRLRINSTSGKIGINTVRPESKVKQSPADVDIRQNKGKLEIHRDNVEITVDNYPSRYDMGLKNNEDRAKEYSREGERSAFEAAARYAREGDQLMDFENIRIEDLESRRNEPEPEEIELVYKRLPEIMVNQGDLDIDYQEQPSEINIQKNAPVIEARRGKVNTYLRQKPELIIEVVGENIDRFG